MQQLTDHQLAALHRLAKLSGIMPYRDAEEIQTSGATLASLVRRGYLRQVRNADARCYLYRLTNAGYEALLGGCDVTNPMDKSRDFVPSATSALSYNHETKNARPL